MILRKELELTESQIKYDKMLRDCNHLRGTDLDAHRESMDELAEKIQKLRQEVNYLLHIKK